jgi:hypothetical protein
MGIKNVSGAYLMWSELSDGAHRLLTGMSYASFDHDGVDRHGLPVTARRFFGGADLLVTYVRSHNERGEVRTYAARRSAAFRFLAQLVEAGAVKVVRAAVNGVRAEYALNVDPLQVETFAALPDASRPVGQRPSQSDAERPSQSDAERPSQSDAERPSQSDAPSKEEQKDEHEDLREENTSPEAVASPAVGVHTTADGRTWSDVPLLTVDTTSYAEASHFLDRTMGTARAGDAVAHLIASGCPSYTDAVVTAAWRAGWEPDEVSKK